MNAKNITIFFLIFAALLGLMWWAKGRQPSAGAQSRGPKSVLTADETFYNFGTVSMAKGNVARVFKLKNDTGKDLSVVSVSTSCMCTKANIIKSDGSRLGPFGMGNPARINEVVPAGGILEVEAVFNPGAHGPAGVGPIDRFVFLTDENGGTLQYEFKAVVTP